jgi:hypothetical protein
MSNSVIGRICGAEQLLAVPSQGSVTLPHQVMAYPVSQARGPHQLLLVLPPTVRARAEGVIHSTAARIRHGAMFELITDHGAPAALQFQGVSTRATARELGVDRCGYCRKPLRAHEPMVKCSACSTASCADCAEAAQCLTCFEPLEAVP